MVQTARIRDRLTGQIKTVPARRARVLVDHGGFDYVDDKPSKEESKTSRAAAATTASGSATAAATQQRSDSATGDQPAQKRAG